MIINGKEVTWDEITRGQLKYLLVNEGLPVSLIAEKFGVTASKVRYKKEKYRLTGVQIEYERFMLQNKELFDIQNANAKKWLLDYGNIDAVSKAIVQFAFRSGPVESVHSKCKEFTDKDMMEINIFMVNHIAGLLTYTLDGNWLQLRILADCYNSYSREWNSAEAETGKIAELFARNYTVV